MKLSSSDLHVLLSSLLFLPFVIALIVTWLKGALTDIEDAKYVVTLDSDPDLWAVPAQAPDGGRVAAIDELPVDDER